MDDGWKEKDWTAAGNRTSVNKPKSNDNVNRFWAGEQPGSARDANRQGATSLPLLGQRVSGHQRAFLKVQDGCDAHCTYCIIPKLRPALWSKPIGDAVEEARRLVDAGHREIILTGIFLGAYGRQTALRRRRSGTDLPPLGLLVEALCKKVPGLKRLRLSSLEPGDLGNDLLKVLAAHSQVVPHFHLPLQSGSDGILRRMNRQYTRDEFLDMVDRVQHAFDRPALTTDVIVGFPGEGEEEFRQTIDVIDRSGFIHIHAFPYSPRPGTAAARWTDQFVHGPIVNERIEELNQLGLQHSFGFRSWFVGHEATVIVESMRPSQAENLWQGRCERYFPIWFESASVRPGDCVRVRIEQITPAQTVGQLVDTEHEVVA